MSEESVVVYEWRCGAHDLSGWSATGFGCPLCRKQVDKNHAAVIRHLRDRAINSDVADPEGWAVLGEEELDAFERAIELLEGCHDSATDTASKAVTVDDSEEGGGHENG